jgi:general secretion pathway protein K
VRTRQRGIALILVLWILVLVTVTTGAYALMARMDQLEANQLLSGTQARLWAEAGLNLAAIALRDPDDTTRLIPDGRPYLQEREGVLVEIRASDERGKLDINAADEITLATLFVNNGLELDQAEALAGAVMDWRDNDDTERVNGAEGDSYEAAGFAIGPANRNFMMVEELLQVLGMTWELYQRMEPGLSVYSSVDLPVIGFAGAEALLAIPDITPEEAWNFVEQRQSQQPEDMLDITLPNGQSAMAQGRGLTYSIRVKATMPNGVWEQLDATIRLGGSPSGQPFRVLRWREGYYY